MRFGGPAWVAVWCFMAREGLLVGLRRRGHDGTFCALSLGSSWAARLALSLCRLTVALA